MFGNDNCVGGVSKISYSFFIYLKQEIKKSQIITPFGALVTLLSSHTLFYWCFFSLFSLGTLVFPLLKSTIYSL